MKQNGDAMTIRILIAITLAAAALLATGCATYPPAPMHAASAERGYAIGPGDTLNIVVFRNPELSTTVTVRPDGKIAAPLVEDLPAAGKDPATLAREVEKALARYIREPVVTIVVTSYVVPYSEQIRVVGEAAKPQMLPYKQDMTLLDVMIAVGGVTNNADGNGSSILRTSQGNRQYGVRVGDLLRRGDMTANVQVVPGDVVIIPQSWY
jgi:polysaccharide biosynthesis/export protein